MRMKVVRKKENDVPGKQGRSAQVRPGVQVRPSPMKPFGQGPHRKPPASVSMQLLPLKQGDDKHPPLRSPDFFCFVLFVFFFLI